MKDTIRLIQIIHILAKSRIDVLFGVKRKAKLNLLLILTYPWRIYSLNKPRGERVREALEEAGTIFIKFGQLLSTRPDLIPIDIAQSLSQLQDDIKAFPTKQAKEIIEDELNCSIEELFTDFDSEPLAAASIAQVYSAKLKKNGEEVVVKVIRPEIYKEIDRDISLMKKLAKKAENYSLDARRLRLSELVIEYEAIIKTELDMRVEASNMRQTKRNFKDNELLYVPNVYLDVSTKKVLVMEKISGIPIDDIGTLKEKEIDLRLVSERGVEIFLKQVFVDNFFHADMHPGNIFISPRDPSSPSYIAVDYAIVGSLDEEEQFQIGRMLLSVISRNFLEISNILIDSGWVDPKTKANELERTIRSACEPMFEQPLEKIKFGELLLYIFESARRFNLRMQPSLMLLQKTLINIEGLGKQINPKLDFWSIAKPFLQEWIKERYNPKKLESWAKKNAGLWIEKARKLPEVAENVLDQINKIEDYQKESEVRHRELIDSLNKERRGRFLLIFLILLVILSSFMFWTIR
ncbi:MAG: 2-polyprenylphenol 6-hydroxylase [Gammaproteobacteria bacterium]|nr:2-polyprenylphenol 6-hydroxylase [Gammaproteobacteria bacterium]|tara:strand:- start:15243 stop:16805 length:1563 start_codon:yes stop_codon:yes gene_type:complete